jgi:hypothetical protein
MSLKLTQRPSFRQEQRRPHLRRRGEAGHECVAHVSFVRDEQLGVAGQSHLSLYPNSREQLFHLWTLCDL